MRIAEISVTEVTAAYPGPQFPPGDRQARQIDVYPEHNATSHINLPSAGGDNNGAVRGDCDGRGRQPGCTGRSNRCRRF